MLHPPSHYDRLKLPLPEIADTSYLPAVCSTMGFQLPAAAEPGRDGWTLEESQRVAAALKLHPLQPVPYQRYMFFMGDLATYKSGLYCDMVCCKGAMMGWNRAVEAMQRAANPAVACDFNAMLAQLETSAAALDAAPVLPTTLGNSTFVALCRELPQRAGRLRDVACLVRFYYAGGVATAGMLRTSPFVVRQALLTEHASRMVKVWAARADAALKNDAVHVSVYTQNVRMCLAWTKHVHPPDKAHAEWLKCNAQAVNRHSQHASTSEHQTVAQEIARLERPQAP